MQLFSKIPTVDNLVAQPIMKGAVFSSSWPLQVRWEWPWAPHPLLIFDCSEDMSYGDFEQDELLFFSVGLYLVARGFLVDGTVSPILALLGSSRLWL